MCTSCVCTCLSSLTWSSHVLCPLIHLWGSLSCFLISPQHRSSDATCLCAANHQHGFSELPTDGAGAFTADDRWETQSRQVILCFSLVKALNMKCVQRHSRRLLLFHTCPWEIQPWAQFRTAESKDRATAHIQGCCGHVEDVDSQVWFLQESQSSPCLTATFAALLPPPPPTCSALGCRCTPFLHQASHTGSWELPFALNPEQRFQENSTKQKHWVSHPSILDDNLPLPALQSDQGKSGVGD